MFLTQLPKISINCRFTKITPKFISLKFLTNKFQPFHFGNNSIFHLNNLRSGLFRRNSENWILTQILRCLIAFSITKVTQIFAKKLIKNELYSVGISLIILWSIEVYLLIVFLRVYNHYFPTIVNTCKWFTVSYLEIDLKPYFKSTRVYLCVLGSKSQWLVLLLRLKIWSGCYHWTTDKQTILRFVKKNLFYVSCRKTYLHKKAMKYWNNYKI